MNVLLRKCKSLSKLGRSSSYSSLSSNSYRGDRQYLDLWDSHFAINDTEDHEVVVFVGRSRRRYIISSKYLNHPLLSALVDRSKYNTGDDKILVKCEVVLFDHLLWMLQNTNFDDVDGAALQELAELYVS